MPGIRPCSPAAWEAAAAGRYDDALVGSDHAHPSSGRGWWTRPADWLERGREETTHRVEVARERWRTVGFVLEAAEHDRMTGGTLLAGALGFRLFLWLLPAALVVVGCLGFVTPSTASANASRAGLGYVATTIETAAAQAHQGRWLLLASGLFALYSASVSLARTLWAATTLAWRMPVAKMRRPTRAAGVVVGIVVSGLGMVLVTGWLRGVNHVLGIIATAAVIVTFTLLGWVLLWLLPRPPDVPARGLLPGAVVIGVGIQVLHLLSVLFLGNELTSASQLYGALGSAAALMVYGYLLARVLIAATTVNRVWAARETPASPGADDAAPEADGSG